MICRSVDTPSLFKSRNEEKKFIVVVFLCGMIELSSIREILIHHPSVYASPPAVEVGERSLPVHAHILLIRALLAGSLCTEDISIPRGEVLS